MFPDRVERMVLDGVLNAHEYYGGHDFQMNADSDATMDELIKRCFDVPSNCALAHDGATPEATISAFWDWFRSAKYDPLVVDGLYVDQASVQGFIRPMLYDPAAWPTVAYLLDGLLSANSTRITEGIIGVSARLPAYASGDGLGDDSAFGIQGADKTPRVDSLRDFFPIMGEFEETSALIGASMALGQMRYVQWPFVARERLTGEDFASSTKTKAPILFVGNSFDPATPLRSARTMAAGFEGSVVLEHGGVGHCSMRHPSTCTADAVQRYFVDGALPDEGTVCAPSVEAYAVPEDVESVVVEHFGFGDL
jgi:pimeloyl-ACP methyl ester carboxylesterase